MGGGAVGGRRVLGIRVSSAGLTLPQPEPDRVRLRRAWSRDGRRWVTHTAHPPGRMARGCIQLFWSEGKAVGPWTRTK